MYILLDKLNKEFLNQKNCLQYLELLSAFEFSCIVLTIEDYKFFKSNYINILKKDLSKYVIRNFIIKIDKNNIFICCYLFFNKTQNNILDYNAESEKLLKLLNIKSYNFIPIDVDIFETLNTIEKKIIIYLHHLYQLSSSELSTLLKKIREQL